MSKEIVYQSKWFEVTIDDYSLPNGGTIKNFHRINTNNSAVIVICDPNNESFLLLKEFRPALQKFCLTLPGGGIEKNENNIDCIKREINEEISIEIRNIVLIGETINNGNYHFGSDIVYFGNLLPNSLISSEKFKDI